MSEILDHIPEETSRITLAEIADRKNRVSISRTFKDAWNLYKRDAGSYIGFCFMFLIIFWLLGKVTDKLPGVLPSALLDGVVSICMSAGFYTYLRVKRRPVDSYFGSFFHGFSWPLAGSLMMVGGITIGVQLIFLAVNAYYVESITTPAMEQAIKALQNPKDLEEMIAACQVLLDSGYFRLTMIVSPILSLLLMLLHLVPLLLIFRDESFGECLKYGVKFVAQRYLLILGIMILFGILFIISMLPLFIGLLITFPLYSMIWYSIYCQITGEELYHPMSN